MTWIATKTLQGMDEIMVSCGHGFFHFPFGHKNSVLHTGESVNPCDNGFFFPFPGYAFFPSQGEGGLWYLSHALRAIAEIPPDCN